VNDHDRDRQSEYAGSALSGLFWFCLNNKFVIYVIAVFLLLWGLMVAPFDWRIPFLGSWLPKNPVSVDAIPDIGENQQIVFTDWAGRSPKDIEDQISYPLTTSLLGIPGVKTVRTTSAFGFSTVFVIFDDKTDFYWSRSRILEKLDSLPEGTLPPGVKPTLGPDATALGQVFWYTLEGLDEAGNNVGGWDLNELRSVQDWQVRYALLAAGGISEVASIGGHVQEYQVESDPDALRYYGLSMTQLADAVRSSNLDVGARTIEINGVEYMIRGIGFVRTIADIEDTVVAEVNNVPIYIRNLARTTLGPAMRRGALDKGGTEAVGGVVVVRYQGNPLAAIENVKRKIAEITPSLPTKAVVDWLQISRAEVAKFAERNGFAGFSAEGELNQKAWSAWLRQHSGAQRPNWLTYSQVRIVPFYDRSGLIRETIGTLDAALVEELLVTALVILIMLMHLRSSMVVCLTLPMAVLICFIIMKTLGVDANIVALSGIAIAIGTICDMGIVICENIMRHLKEERDPAKSLFAVFKATDEVGSAVLTAISTTVVGFLPVFMMTGPEGKLFQPLAYTKMFALIASVVTALTLIPVVAHDLYSFKIDGKGVKRVLLGLLLLAGIGSAWRVSVLAGSLMVVFAAFHLVREFLPARISDLAPKVFNVLVFGLVLLYLSQRWMPRGPAAGVFRNLALVAFPIVVILGSFLVFLRWYRTILGWCLAHKLAFLSIPSAVVVLGLVIWLGFGKVFSWLPEAVRAHPAVVGAAHRFPGLGKEFMPTLDEGSFLYMPTTMPHASSGEALDILSGQDRRFDRIPEVEMAVGKVGRAQTVLDPAPMSMIETVINYRPEFRMDRRGRRLAFRFDPTRPDLFRDESGKAVDAPDGKPYQVRGTFSRDDQGRLIEDGQGMPFRLWRPPLDPALNPGRAPWPGIRNPNDIWDEIVRAGDTPGATSAPKLQPIAARIVMLQSGMRAPMGIKIKGPDLASIQAFGQALEAHLKEVPGVEPSTVIADRIIGKPYLEIVFDRQALARYGFSMGKVQEELQLVIGGMELTRTVEGRERYAVAIRYPRERRLSPDAFRKILFMNDAGQQIPLRQIAALKYTPGPDMIKSEDGFLVGYVLFDKVADRAETEVVENAAAHLAQLVEAGTLILPAGVSYTFAGTYENQVRAQKTLALVLPLALFIIYLLLYLQFRSTSTSLLVFSGIAVAWAGGFILIWLYGEAWFMNFSVFGTNLRELFRMHNINLSVAIWVGFLALFGIATDDGVVMGTYLEQRFKGMGTMTVAEIRRCVLDAGEKRVRPCLMTTATTVLALLPVLSSTGRGADIMIPMAIPSFGGMIFETMTMLVVPVLYCAIKEHTRKRVPAATGEVRS
jgi:Cu(I)/Ag(I) efflux system membrane protein CusA/SilA